MSTFNISEKGFSLIEVLVAMAIFALGSLAVVALYYSTSGSLRTSNELSDAVFIAEEYLSRTLSLDYNYQAAGESKDTDCKTAKFMKDCQYTGVKDKYTVGIDIVPKEPATGESATITVVVSWKRLFGLSNNSYTIQYIRAETKATGL